jgi:hypothetical protein
MLAFTASSNSSANSASTSANLSDRKEIEEYVVYLNGLASVAEEDWVEVNYDWELFALG